jgi:KDO2-lipid IV(A) lauroyltransferase
MTYWFFRLIATATRVVPRRVLCALCGVLGTVIHFLRRGEARVVAANQQRVASHRGQPLAPAAARRRARRVYVSFLKTVMDYFYFGAHPDDLPPLVTVENIGVLDETRAHGRGTIIISAHVGSVDNGAALVARHGYACHIVVITQQDPRQDELFQRQRLSRDMRIVPIGRATRECVRALQRNEAVALVGDRDFTPNRETTMFFGVPARLPTGAARLALATGAAVVFSYCVRQPDDRFRLYFCDPFYPDKARDTVESLNRRIAERLERAIGEHSEQWHIFHDLWDVDADWRLAQTYTHQK